MWAPARRGVRDFRLVRTSDFLDDGRHGEGGQQQQYEHDPWAHSRRSAPWREARSQSAAISPGVQPAGEPCSTSRERRSPAISVAVKFFPRRVREVEDSDLIATEAAHTAIFPGERRSGHLSFLFSASIQKTCSRVASMMSSKVWFAAMRGDNDALIRLIAAGGDIEHKGVRRRPPAPPRRPSVRLCC